MVAIGPGSLVKRVRALAVLVVLSLLALSPAAQAHDPFEITTDAKVFRERLTLHVAMSSRTAAALCWGLGRDPNDFEQSDLDEFPERFRACARSLYRVTSRGALLEPTSVRVRLSVEHDFEATLLYPPAAPGPLRFEATQLSRLASRDYGAVLTAVSESTVLGQMLLRADQPALEVAVPAGTPPRAAKLPAFSEFFRLGVAHILSGYDHVLFLAGVLLGCSKFGEALLLVTGFTLGHSVTLALAALNWLALPSVVVEPLIALSIVFVGLEALSRWDSLRARVPITVLFGAVHGFGFAGALRDRGLGGAGASIGIPLFAFNVGVELGQLLVAAPFTAFVLWLAPRPKIRTPLRRAVSVFVCVAGVYWFLQRVFFRQ